MEHYTPENLKLWSTPDDWFGTPWHGHYVFLFQHRGSNLIDQSNFTCALDALGGESETVHVVREGHWAVGWIEWLAIHQSDIKALKIADDIADALAEYPILDESHYSDLEAEAINEYWQDAPLSDKIDWCSEAGESVFSSRHARIPEKVYPVLSDLVNEG